MSKLAAGPSPWRQRGNLVGGGLLILLLAALPWVFSSPYALSTMVLIGIYAIVTLGLCLLMGYAGQISLGHAAFFGLGAYGSAILTTRWGVSPWVALVVSAIATAGLAYVIGLPIFRLRGHYLAMGTLAFGYIVRITLDQWKSYTGGPTGLPGIPPLTLLGWTLRSDRDYYGLVWVIVVVGLVVALNVVNSRFGRALRALRGSELAAVSLGIDVQRSKLQVLALSGLYASVAGSIYAHYMTFVSPSVSALDLSIRLVLMAAVGGMASIWGAPLGALAVILLTMGLREIVPLFTAHGSGEYQIIAYGALLIAIMVFMPEGLAVAAARWWKRTGGWATLRAWWTRRRTEARRG